MCRPLEVSTLYARRHTITAVRSGLLFTALIPGAATAWAAWVLALAD